MLAIQSDTAIKMVRLAKYIPGCSGISAWKKNGAVIIEKYAHNKQMNICRNVCQNRPDIMVHH